MGNESSAREPDVPVAPEQDEMMHANRTHANDGVRVRPILGRKPS